MLIKEANIVAEHCDHPLDTHAHEINNLKHNDFDKTQDHNHHGHNHGEGLISKDGKILSKTSALLLVVALSTHSIFEGIALGLQTEFSSLWELSLGIVLHHIPAAISLGGTCCRSSYSIPL